MKLEIELNDKAKSGVKKTFFGKVFKETIEKSGLDFLSGKKLSVSLAVVSEEEMRRLNRTYRHVDSSTDVLSFSEYKNQKELSRAGDKAIFLGEIILCYNNIRKYAKKNRKVFRQELSEVASHGLLHILGFRHGKKMFEVQKIVSKNFKNY